MTETEPQPCPLNQRELEILTQLSHGASRAEAAEALGLSMLEVARSWRRIKYQTGKNKGAAMVALALREGWIQ